MARSAPPPSIPEACSLIKHQETHPNLDVPDCFGCKIASLTWRVPLYMSSKVVGKQGMTGIEQSAAYDRDLKEALKKNPDLQRA